MDSFNLLTGLICGVTAVLALLMLFSEQPLSCALSLLGVLLGTAALYGLMGEHFIATVQLVVYAGAIMVLFIFSIMLLNLKHQADHYNSGKIRLVVAGVLGMAVFILLTAALMGYFSSTPQEGIRGQFGRGEIQQLGGNSLVLSHALFTQHYISFEMISLALLVALVGAVVLAKRKFD